MNRLKELRKEKKLSQKELADYLGINEKTISRWENGESTIKSDKAQKLADFFGVNIGYLLGNDEKPYKELSDFIGEINGGDLEGVSFKSFSKEEVIINSIVAKLKTLPTDDLQLIDKIIERFKQ